jgi:hypothetical protein
MNEALEKLHKIKRYRNSLKMNIVFPVITGYISKCKSFKNLRFVLEKNLQSDFPEYKIEIIYSYDIDFDMLKIIVDDDAYVELEYKYGELITENDIFDF